MKGTMKRALGLCVAVLVTLASVCLPAAAAAPTTKTGYTNWFPSSVTLLEQKYGLANLGDENAHLAPLSLGIYQYQLSIADNAQEPYDLLYAGDDFVVSNYLENYLVITFSGSNLPKSVCLGIESYTVGPAKVTGETVYYSVNGGADVAYTTPVNAADGGCVITDPAGIGTITLKNNIPDYVWGVLTYMLLPDANLLPQENIPAAPTAAGKTGDTVTLNTITGAEYSLDGTTWQSSTVFTGLSPLTEYTFYARYAQTDTYFPSPASAGTAVTTDKANQAAPAAPTIASKTSDTVTLNTITGAEYSLDGTTWQSSPTFTDLSPATAYTFYAYYPGTATQYASPASTGTAVTTDKADQSAPSAPTVASKISDTVTLNTITGAEYSLDGTTWQSGTVFTGLSPLTEYTFYARYAETATQLASPASTGTAVTTDKANQAAPSAPTVASKTSDTVTLNTITGAEYSLDGTTWQSSPTFTGLSPATAYTFYIRYAETDTAFASEASRITVQTDAIPDGPNDNPDTGSASGVIPALLMGLAAACIAGVPAIRKKFN